MKTAMGGREILVWLVVGVALFLVAVYVLESEGILALIGGP